MPRNKQYLSVKYLKEIGVKINSKQFEQIAARYLDHTYPIYEIRDIIKTYRRGLRAKKPTHYGRSRPRRITLAKSRDKDGLS